MRNWIGACGWFDMTDLLIKKGFMKLPQWRKGKWWKVLIDIEQVKMFDKDGNDIWSILKNIGSIVSLNWSWQGDDNLLMFCAAALTKEVMNNVEDDVWVLSDDFKNAIREFGDYVILLSSVELRNKIMESEEGLNNRIGIDTGMII